MPDPLHAMRRNPVTDRQPQRASAARAGVFVPALSVTIAGKLPMAVARSERGRWFVMGALPGSAGITSLVSIGHALPRGGCRGTLTAAVVFA